MGAAGRRWRPGGQGLRAAQEARPEPAGGALRLPRNGARFVCCAARGSLSLLLPAAHEVAHLIAHKVNLVGLDKEVGLVEDVDDELPAASLRRGAGVEQGV